MRFPRRRTKRNWLITVLVVGLVAGGGSLTLGQELGRATKNTSPWTKAGKDKPGHPGAPGSHHEHMKKFVGRWQAKTRIYPGPDAEPIEMSGSMSNSMIMGGRFLQSDFKGEMMGRKFTGMGYEGFDNARQEHVATWVDNENTEIFYFRGTCNDDRTVITAFSERLDAKTGNVKKIKSVTTLRSTSMYTFENWEEGDDGEYRKTMEIIYTRS